MAATTPPSSLELKYFPIPGRGEPIRLALAINEIPFTNTIITFEEWPNVKSSTPYEGIPILIIDGKEERAQATALLRYASRLGNKGLYPSDPLEALRVDEVTDYADDVLHPSFATWFPAHYGIEPFPTDEARKAHCDRVFGDILPPRFAKLDSIVAANDGGDFLVGDHVTMADLKWYHVVKLLSTVVPDFPTGFFDAYPNVMAMYRSVEAVPEVQAWYAQQ